MHGRTVGSYTCNVHVVTLAVAFPVVRYLKAGLYNTRETHVRASEFRYQLWSQLSLLVQASTTNRLFARAAETKRALPCETATTLSETRDNARVHARAQIGAPRRASWGFVAKCVRHVEERMCSLCLRVGGGCHVVWCVCVCVCVSR